MNSTVKKLMGCFLFFFAIIHFVTSQTNRVVSITQVSGNFTCIVSAPEVYGVDNIFTCPGEILRIDGKNLNKTLLTVLIHGKEAKIIEKRENFLRVEMPQVLAGSTGNLQIQYGEVQFFFQTCLYRAVTSIILTPIKPILSSVSPTDVCVGDEISINGTNLLNVSKVTLGRTDLSPTFSSNTLIKVRLPNTYLGENIGVTNGCGTSNINIRDVQAPPSDLSVKPLVQCAGKTIEIRGGWLGGTQSVSIGGVRVGFKEDCEGFELCSPFIVATIPIDGTVRSGDIVVTNRCGSTTIRGFRVILPPTITGIVPTSACVGGEISVNGANFEEGSGLQVRVGGVLATVRWNSSTSLSVTVPSGAVSGTVQVTTNVNVGPNTCGGTATRSFTLLKRPRINAINPLSSCAGSNIVISGSDLSGVSSVSVGGVNTTFSFNANNNTLLVKVPSGVTSGKIVISNACGSDERDGFVLLSVPILEQVTPLTACVNQTITMTGSYLNTVTSVQIGGKSVLFQRSGNSISVLTDSTFQSGDVVVTNSCGRDTIKGFEMILPPKITRFEPISACEGQEISVSGSNFSDLWVRIDGGFAVEKALKVRIGGVIASYKRNSSTSLLVTVPAGAVSGSIQVINTFCETTASLSGFTLLKRPKIDAINPLSSCAGSTITISGSELSGVRSVSVGGVNTTFSFNGSTNTLQVRVPSSVSSGRIVVSNECGSDERDGFVLLPVPILEQVTPLTACVNQTVILTGSHLSTVTSVQIGGKSVLFQRSGNSISVLTDSTFQSGDVVVTNSCGRDTIKGFRVVLPPKITRFEPISACVGQKISVSGSNFEGEDILQVRVGGVIATYTRNSSTSLSVTVPAGAVSGSIQVTNTLCGTTAASLAGFTLLKRPRIDAINPLSSCSGSTITISGSDLSGVSSVSVGGVNTSFGFNSNTNTLLVRVPSSISSGKIVVTNACGSDERDGFVLLSVPILEQVRPLTACVNQTVILTGSHLSTVTSVQIGGKSVLFQRSGNSISVLTDSTFQSGDVVVTNPCGRDTIKGFRVVLPQITGFTPVEVCTDKNVEVTILGKDLLSPSVFVGQSPLILSQTSDSLLRVIVPKDTRADRFRIRTLCGMVSSKDTFKIAAAPTIGSVSQDTLCPGVSQIDIKGGFLNDVVVSIGNQIVSSFLTDTSGNQLRINIPGNLPLGNHEISISKKYCAPVILSKRLTRLDSIPVPELASNTVCTGEKIRIVNLSGNPEFASFSVFLGLKGNRDITTPIKLVSVKSGNEIIAAIPDNLSAGIYEVYLQGKCGISRPVELTLRVQPTISRIIPVSPCIGDTLLVSGTNLLSEGLEVRIGGIMVPILTNSSNSLLRIHLTKIYEGPLEVKGTFLCKPVQSAGIKILPKAEIRSVSPLATCPNTEISILGLNLANVNIDFEGSIIKPLFTSDTLLKISSGNKPGTFRVSPISSCAILKPEIKVIVRPIAPPVDAGVDRRICLGDSIQLNAKPILESDWHGGGVWKVIRGAAELKNIYDPQTTIKNIKPDIEGLLILEWSYYETECPPNQICEGPNSGSVPLCSSKVSDTMSITVFSPPSPAKIVIPSSSAICNSITLDLKAQPIAIGRGTWKVITGPGQIDFIDRAETRIRGLVPGQNTRIRWMVEHGVCPSVSDEINLINTPATLPADAGQDKTVCIGVPSLRLDASIREGQSGGRWSLLPGFGTAVFRDPTQPNTEIFQMVPNASGELVLRWEVFGRGCLLRPNDNVDLVKINFDFPPQATILSKDTVLCQGTDYGLIAKSDFSGIGKWTVLDNNGKIQNQNSSQTAITGLSPGRARVAWSVKSGQCPEVSDTISIQVDEKPVAFAGNPQTLCAQKEARLNAQIPVVGIGKWQVEQVGVVIENSSSPNTKIFGLPDSGKIELVWIVQNGACPAVRSETYLLNYLEPSAANAGKDTAYCENSPVQLAAEKPKIGTGQWSVSSGTARVLNEKEVSSPVIGLTRGSTVTFRWSVSNGVCPVKSDEVIIKVDPLPSLAIAGRDTSLCGQDSFRLEAVAPLIGEGSWRILNGNVKLDNPKLTNTRLTGLQQGTSARIVWEVRSGVCPISMDSIEITGLNIGPDVAPGFLIRDTFCVSDSVKVIEISGSGDSLFAQNASFRWEFGDGSTSSVRDPVHRYRAAGTYPVRLRVNKGFCRSFEISKWVFVKPAPCTTPRDFVNRGTPIINPFVSLSSFPNPTSGTFRVEAVLAQPMSVIIRIRSSEGRLLEMRQRSGTNLLAEDFDLQHSGFFVVEVSANGVSRHFRMIGIRP